jgi:uncharacterized membrane protein
MRRFIRSQFGFILYGLAFWLPIAIVVFVVLFLFNYVEDAGRRLFLLFFPAQYFYEGFGAVLGLLVLYLSGVILKISRIRKRLSKIPILGLLFGGGDVITVERLGHLAPCLFMMSPTCLAYGWVLSEEKVRLEKGAASFIILNVYYPNVPTLVTGQVFPVRKDTVIRLGNPSKEVIDLLLYAFRSPAALVYLPWEGEPEEEFQKRAVNFGINIPPR